MGIFDFMKIPRIQAFFLTLVVMMPLLTTSFTLLEDRVGVYEMSENTEAEEQKDERESEKKEGKDTVEEYLLHNSYACDASGDQGLEFDIRSNNASSISTDVLTPPPEFI